MRFRDTRMLDGSRHFVSLPETRSPDALRDHIARLPGAVVTKFVFDGIVEAWIVFRYGGHEFSVNNQFGDYWFFVQDPACPDSTLQEVAAYCATASRSEHSLAGLNLETDGMKDVTSRFGPPKFRDVAPGPPAPGDRAVSHSEWPFDSFTLYIAGWWFLRSPESERILGLRLEGATCPDELQTGAGIKLGSTRSQVIQAYGEVPPQGKADLPFEDGYRLTFGFSESGLVNRIQLMAPTGR